MFICFVEVSNIPENETLLQCCSAVEPIMMYGYPTGLWDSVNHFPLIRTGHTASHPGIDFNGVAEGRMCLPNYNVDSGAPIFTLPQVAVLNKQTGVHIGGNSVKLLGMHHDGLTNHSSLGLGNPPEDFPEESLVLGKYLKSSLLLDIGNWSIAEE